MSGGVKFEITVELVAYRKVSEEGTGKEQCILGAAAAPGGRHGKKWGIWAARVLGEGCKSNSKRVNGKAGTKGIGLTEKTKEQGAGRTAQKRGV